MAVTGRKATKRPAATPTASPKVLLAFVQQYLAGKVGSKLEGWARYDSKNGITIFTTDNSRAGRSSQLASLQKILPRTMFTVKLTKSFSGVRSGAGVLRVGIKSGKKGVPLCEYPISIRYSKSPDPSAKNAKGTFVPLSTSELNKFLQPAYFDLPSPTPQTYTAWKRKLNNSIDIVPSIDVQGYLRSVIGASSTANASGHSIVGRMTMTPIDTEVFDEYKKEILKNFGEVVSPVLLRQLRTFQGSGVSVRFPEGQNNPLFDYEMIIETQGKTVTVPLSAKVGKSLQSKAAVTTNTVKSSSLLPAFERKKALGTRFRKEGEALEKTLQYKILEALGEVKATEGPAIVLELMLADSKLSKVVESGFMTHRNERIDPKKGFLRNKLTSSTLKSHLKQVKEKVVSSNAKEKLAAAVEENFIAMYIETATTGTNKILDFKDVFIFTTAHAVVFSKFFIDKQGVFNLTLVDPSEGNAAWGNLTQGTPPKMDIGLRAKGLSGGKLSDKMGLTPP